MVERSEVGEVGIQMEVSRGSENAFQCETTSSEHDEERHLWYDFLKGYSEHIYRQRIFGHYIADFYCAAAKLIIEVDGSQHFEAYGMAYDEERTKYLEQYGVAVLRISNREVNQNFRGVCEYIDDQTQNRKHHLK